MSATHRHRSTALLAAASSKAASRSVPEDRQKYDPTKVVRVFFLDGSFKAFQIRGDSTVWDVLVLIKQKLDLSFVGHHALFLVKDGTPKRLPLAQPILDFLGDDHNVQRVDSSPKLLFRPWIYVYGGRMDKEIMHSSLEESNPSQALWLAYTDAVYMVMSGRYQLTADEALLVGCLKTQVQSGDYDPAIHTRENIRERIAKHFPYPLKAIMKRDRENTQLEDRVLTQYARLAGMAKMRAQRELLATLQTWCPQYGATFFPVQCQYDHEPMLDSSPPVLEMIAAVGPAGVHLISKQPAAMFRHPYTRIAKWMLDEEEHILAYWLLKEHVRIEQLNDVEDPTPLCEVIYLVAENVGEIEFLVAAYADADQGKEVSLPDYPGEDNPEAEAEEEPLAAERPVLFKLSSIFAPTNEEQNKKVTFGTVQDPAPRPAEAPTAMFQGITGDSSDDEDDGRSRVAGPGRLVHSIDQLQRLAAQDFVDEEDSDSEDDGAELTNQTSNAVTAPQQRKKGLSTWFFGGRKS